MPQSSIHTAIIMDGNGRWAERLGLPRAAGHKAGAEALRRVVEAAPGLGIGTLSAYAFSADNWKRPPEEVDTLMALLGWYLESEALRLQASGVRLSIIGRRDRLPAALLETIYTAEAATWGCRRLHLRLAIDYSARETILRATEQCGGVPDRFEQLMGQAPSVDALIRTGGEQRLSDFLLWECAYAELIFTNRMWPEFDGADLARAMAEFRRRNRRFGATPSPPPVAVANERWLR